MRIDRIPGFAICASCGLHTHLEPCHACGLLACADCRDPDECAVCHRERREWARRTLRRARAWRWAQRVVATGVTGLGMLVLVGGPLSAAAPRSARTTHAAIVARVQARLVADAVDRYLDDHDGRCPPSLRALTQERYLSAAPAKPLTIDPWGEPLLFGCVEVPRSFVIVSKGPDHEVGTGDDVNVLP